MSFCSQVLAVVNNTAMNMGMHGSLQYPDFNLYIYTRILYHLSHQGNPIEAYLRDVAGLAPDHYNKVRHMNFLVPQWI